MSSSEDAAAEASAKPDRQEKMLQYYLLSTTVPFRDGGGVVFPNGFPGGGYRLDDWQFDRYRAQLDQIMLGIRARQRRRLVLILLGLFALGVFAISFGFPFLSRLPALAPFLDGGSLKTDSWLPLMLILLGAFAFRRVVRSVTLQGITKPEKFAGAPKVGPLAFLHRRVLGMLASGQISIAIEHLRAAVFGGLALLLFALEMTGGNLRGAIFLPAALLVLVVTRPIYFCWAYWSFRLKHGRRPTPEDLAPVDPPAHPLSA